MGLYERLLKEQAQETHAEESMRACSPADLATSEFVLRPASGPCAPGCGARGCGSLREPPRWEAGPKVALCASEWSCVLAPSQIGF